MADRLRALVFQPETAQDWGWFSLAASSRGLEVPGLAFSEPGSGRQEASPELSRCRTQRG